MTYIIQIHFSNKHAITMELTGSIKHIGKRTSRDYNGKTYWSQRLLVTTDEDTQYPQVIPMDIVERLQDRMDEYAVGQTVKMHYNIRGREYTNKTTNEPDAFLKLEVWKIERIGAAPTSTPAPQQQAQTGSVDDLPF